MPTVGELLAETQAKLATNDTQRATLQQQIKDREQLLAQAEARRAVLKTRLEALQTLMGEEP